MAAIFTLAATRGLAATPNPETIQATSSQAGNTIGVTLIVYSYSTSSDLEVLSRSFQEGQDRELASALFKTKTVGRCLIAGESSYDVAFIQRAKDRLYHQPTASVG
jgi:squalene cyclase